MRRKNYEELKKTYIRAFLGFFSITVALFVFYACSSEKGNFDKTENASSKSIAKEQTFCHFVSFEVNLPGDWAEAGNTTKFYTSRENPDIYFILGESDNPEKDIAKNLELFLSREFYSGKIRFEYEISENEKVKGILKNERTDEELCFSGYFFDNPSSYIFCFGRDLSLDKRVEELTEGAKRTYKALK